MGMALGLGKKELGLQRMFVEPTKLYKAVKGGEVVYV
jgi:hypothetical protein